ncbi:MAG: hypothetical protein K0R66_353 [Gammaproteobacteria bacterium]|jgi:hypothetical protein|nr:hypothetical protein [Gammaproteobacteria bacterium]
MYNSLCAVIPKSRIDDKRIKAAIKTLDWSKDKYPCPFEPLALPAKYDHDGEKFCLMHHPAKVDHLNVEAIIAYQKLFENGFTDFKFVNLQPSLGQGYWGLGPRSLSDHSEARKYKMLDFTGAFLQSPNFCNIVVEEIRLHHTEIKGDAIFQNVLLGSLILKNCLIACNHMIFHGVQIDSFEISGSKFEQKGYSKRCGTLDFSGLDIGKDSRISNFYVAQDNTIQIPISFMSCKVSRIILEDATYEACPSFFGVALDELKELQLPSKAAYAKILHRYSYLYLIKQSLKQLWNNPVQSIKNIPYYLRMWKSKNPFLIYEYQKFRQIYNIAKDRGMYLEQSDYYCLMRKCLENNRITPWVERLLSRLYGLFSNYGQSIIKPIIFSSLTMVVSAYLYHNMYKIDLDDAFLISEKQVIKPFSLLYDKDQQAILNATLHQSEIAIGTFDIYYGDGRWTITKHTASEVKAKVSLASAYWLSVIESSCTSILIFLLFLAVRWNFRRA